MKKIIILILCISLISFQSTHATSLLLNTLENLLFQQGEPQTQQQTSPPVCNNNGVCDPGESINNCFLDCYTPPDNDSDQITTPTTPITTQDTTPPDTSQQVSITQKKEFPIKIILSIVITAIFIIIVIVLFFWVKRKHETTPPKIQKKEPPKTNKYGLPTRPQRKWGM